MLGRHRDRLFATSSPTNGSSHHRSPAIWHGRGDNETDAEDSSSAVQKGRIIRWRRESTTNEHANMIIAGSMLFMVLVVVAIVFYLSHRSMKKRGSVLAQRRWLESDASLEVYTVDQFFDSVPSPANRAPSSDAPSNSVPIQPPPSYEAAVCSTTNRNPNKIMQQIHLLGAKTNCNCQNQQLLAGQQYDLVKKCRQCRRIIRDAHDSDSDDNNAEFCQCLLQNTVAPGTADHVSADTRADHPGCLADTVPEQQATDGVTLERYESEEMVDDSGLPTYRTAAKLGLNM